MTRVTRPCGSSCRTRRARASTGPSALGVIKNDGPIPRAWLGRFGRTVAEQVLDAALSRMRVARQPGVEVTLAGQRVGDGRSPVGGSDGAARLSDWLEGDTDPDWRDRDGPTSLASRGVTQRDLLSGSSFAVTAETAQHEYVTLWARGAVTRFDGREGDLTLDGEVASAMVGADWVRDAWTAGLIASRSVGEGHYGRQQQRPDRGHAHGPLSLGAACALRADGRLGGPPATAQANSR